MQTPSRKFLKVGDTVRACRDLSLVKAGALGIVVEKNCPLWSTGLWSVTIQFVGANHKTGLPYPDASLVELVAEADANVRTSTFLGRTVLVA